MKEYHKINSVYKRDPQTNRFIEGEWSCAEFGYLQNCQWGWEEKIDGINIRVMWDGQQTRFGGKTDNASIPAPLVARLIELFPREKFIQHFPRLPDNAEACLYGEGYGTKIQKGGGNYKADGVDFILFDVRVGNWWLRREDVAGIAESLGVRMVPFVQSGNLIEAIDYVKHGECPSAFGAFQMEGLVCRPLIELFARNGGRIITKVKCRDFQ